MAGVNIFKLFGSIFVDTEEADKSISKTSKNAESFASKLGKGISTAGKWGAAIVGAGAAAGTALVGLASSSAGSADEIDKMSAKIGLSKQGYQEWSYVMAQNGADINSLQMGIKTLVGQMDGVASGTASSVEAFDKLGLSVYDADGKLKDQETMMNEVMLSLANMENGTEKARLATELFGRSGSELMPMLNNGAESMLSLTERAHELGLIMSDETVGAGVELGDLMDDVKSSIGMLVTQLGTALFPIMKMVCETLIANLPLLQGMFGAMAPILANIMEKLLPPLLALIESLLPVIMSLITTILPPLTEILNMLIPPVVQIIETLLPVVIELLNMLLPPILQIIDMVLPLLLSLLEPILPLLQPILQLLQPVIDLLLLLLQPLIDLINMILPPVIKLLTSVISVALVPLQKALEIFKNVASGIFGTVFDVVKNTINSVKSVFSEIISFVKNVFTGNWKGAFENVKNIFSTIFNSLKDTAKSIWDKIVGVIKAPINGIIDMINKMIDAMNSLSFDIPDWVPVLGGKSFGFNIGKIPKLENGGIVSNGQLFIANERGPELISTSQSSTTVVNNEQIIDAVVRGVTNGVQQVSERIISAIKDARAGDITIPVYLERDLIEEVYISAKERINFRSGGRANA